MTKRSIKRRGKRHLVFNLIIIFMRRRAQARRRIPFSRIPYFAFVISTVTNVAALYMSFRPSVSEWRNLTIRRLRRIDFSVRATPLVEMTITGGVLRSLSLRFPNGNPPKSSAGFAHLPFPHNMWSLGRATLRARTRNDILSVIVS